MDNFGEIPHNIKIDYTGQLEEEGKQQAFLNLAVITSYSIHYTKLYEPMEIIQIILITRPTLYKRGT